METQTSSSSNKAAEQGPIVDSLTLVEQRKTQSREPAGVKEVDQTQTVRRETSLIVADFELDGSFRVSLSNPLRDLASSLQRSVQEFMVSNMDLESAEIGFRGHPQQWSTSKELQTKVRDALRSLNSPDGAAEELTAVPTYKQLHDAVQKLSEQMYQVLRSHSQAGRISADSVQVILPFLGEAKGALSQVVDALDNLTSQVEEAVSSSLVKAGGDATEAA